MQIPMMPNKHHRLVMEALVKSGGKAYITELQKQVPYRNLAVDLHQMIIEDWIRELRHNNYSITAKGRRVLNAQLTLIKAINS